MRQADDQASWLAEVDEALKSVRYILQRTSFAEAERARAAELYVSVEAALLEVRCLRLRSSGDLVGHSEGNGRVLARWLGQGPSARMGRADLRPLYKD